MLIVPIQSAKPGVVLAAGVPHPDQPGTELLKRGYTFGEEDATLVADRLRDLGVTALYVEHSPLAHLDRYLAPLRGKARPIVADVVGRTFAAVAGEATPSVGYADYYAAAHELVCAAVQKGLQGVYLGDLSPRRPDDQAGHAVAVAQLSVMLGLRLERYLISQRSRLNPTHAKEVVNLAVAGMLHDIGKARLPRELREHTAVSPPSDPVERAECGTHARLAYELVGRGVEASAATAMLHHHQRFDGSGDPTGDPAPLAGDRIHVFARILAAADLFDRLSTTACGTRRRPNVEVLHLLRTIYAGWLDPMILHALPRVAPPFAPGSRVTLSDGTAAVVAALDRTDPYRPVVWHVAEDGTTLTGEPIRLTSKTTEVRIASTDGVDVTAMIPEPLETVVAQPNAEAAVAA